MDTLAVIESDPDRLASVIETAALHGDADDDKEMFIRVTDDCVETPASGSGATLASYCTLPAPGFDRLAVTGPTPVDAMFEISPFLGWLDWLESDTVTIRFKGEANVTRTLVLAAEDDEVRMDCPDDPALLDSVETFLPERFDGGQFLDEDGAPMPTTIETTADQLQRLVRAIDLSASGDGYPFVVRDGHLIVDVEGERADVTAPLDAPAEGPAVTNRYGPSFSDVVAGIDGDVQLQTGPGEPVAFVDDGGFATHRFVVTTR